MKRDAMFEKARSVRELAEERRVDFGNQAPIASPEPNAAALSNNDDVLDLIFSVTHIIRIDPTLSVLRQGEDTDQVLRLQEQEFPNVVEDYDISDMQEQFEDEATLWSSRPFPVLAPLRL